MEIYQILQLSILAVPTLAHSCADAFQCSISNHTVLDWAITGMVYVLTSISGLYIAHADSCCTTESFKDLHLNPYVFYLVILSLGIR